jgi:hypothetical protein
MKILKTAIMLLFPSLVMAVTVSWNPPTTNTNGTPIPATGDAALASYLVEWGTCSASAFGTKIGELTVPATATSAEILSLAPACYSFRVYARNTYGSTSLPSTVVQKTIVAPVPNPPTVVTVIAQVYDYQIKGGQILLGRQVGTAPLGTVCGDFVFTGYYKVPDASVTLTRRPRSAVISRCA